MMGMSLGTVCWLNKWKIMKKEIFYGWWIVLAGFIISLYVGSVVFFGFTAFIEPIRREFGWNYTQISLAASLRGLEMGIFAPLVGFLADRFGSRKLILCGTITVGAGLILLSTTQSLAMFYGSFILLGFGAGGCAGVVLSTVVANWFKKKVGIALGVMVSGFGASGLIVPLIVRLIDLYQWRTTLIILGLGMWAIGVPLSFVIRNRPEQFGYLLDGGVSACAAPNIETEIEVEKIGFKEALREKAFFYLAFADGMRMLTVMAVITHVMPYLNNIGIPRSTAGVVAGAIPLVSIIGRLGMGKLADIFDKRYVMALALMCMGLGTLVFSYVHVKPVIFIPIFLLLFSPGFGGMMVLRGALLREYFGRDIFGKLIGFTMGSAAIGGIIGPTLAGLIFDALGSYQFVWLAFCAPVGLAIVLILKIR